MPDESSVAAPLRAQIYAAQMHAGQRRKDASGTPYINHPLVVAELCARVGKCSDSVDLQAAVLHDTRRVYVKVSALSSGFASKKRRSEVS